MPTERFTYSFRTENVGGEIKYFAIFTDGDGNPQETEIPREVYMALEDCRRHEQRQTRSDERHIEQSLLSDEQLIERAEKPPAPMDEAISLSLDLRAALPLLTEIQRRRFLLHHEHSLSFEQIAQAENRSKSTIAESITTATEKLNIFFSSYPNERGP